MMIRLLGLGRTHTSLEIFLLGETSTYACGTTHTFLFFSSGNIALGTAFRLFDRWPCIQPSPTLSIAAEQIASGDPL